MISSPALGRDMTLAGLALLHAAGSASEAPASGMVALLEGLQGEDLRAAWSGGGIALAGIPDWLSAESSGLGLVLNAATEPDAPGATASAPAQIARLLGHDLVGDLLSLADSLLSGNRYRPAPPAVPVTVLAVDGGFVATSLWPASLPVSEHSWFTPAETLTDLPAETVAAVRRALSPFESLAECTLKAAAGVGEGYVWPSVLSARPLLGLRSALAALARTADLSPLPPSLIAIGECAGDGSFVALSDGEAAACAAAVAHLSCEVLIPTVSGWRLTRSDADVVNVIDAGHSLDAAAQLIWEDEWGAWKRCQHGVELVQLGWVSLDWRAEVPNQPIPETDVSQVDSLYAIFHEGRKVAVLGGTPSSGKSVIVRRLAARLARRQKHPALIRVIASVLHELPDRQTALRVGQHALGMEPAVSRQRQILVLEDLYPVGNGNVDDLLPFLSRSLSASILAVLQYDPNSSEEWQTDHLSVVPAVVGRQAMREFVKRLCREHPDRLNQSAGLAELERLRPTRDVKRLIQIMTAPASTAVKEALSPARDALLSSRFTSLQDDAQVALARTAAWSLARSGVEHEVIDVCEPELTAAFGVQAGTSGTLYSVSSPDDCRTILMAYGSALRGSPGSAGDADAHSAQASNAMLADLLMPRLLVTLRKGSREALTLLQGIRLYRNSLCAEVVRRSWKEGALRDWLQLTKLGNIAHLLVSLNVWLNDVVVDAALKTLLTRLREGSDWISLEETLVILRCLRVYFSEISPRWRELRNWIPEHVATILAEGSGSSSERFELLRRVDSFHDLALKELVAERSVDVLPGLDPSRADDYRLVQRVRTMQRRAQDALGWNLQSLPLHQEEPVQALLNQVPPEHVGFHVILGWLTLLRYFKEDDWETLLEKYEERFAAAMRYTSAHEFSQAIDELRHFGPSYANDLIMRAWRTSAHRAVKESRPFFEAIRRLLHDSAPMDAAEIIRSISSVHARAAFDLLHSGPDVPNEDLAAKLADRAAGQTDSKAAGLLLTVTHAVDDLYLTRGTGFAQRLGESLGEERTLKLLREDPRPSVKYYLIRGLWDAQVSFRHACLGTVRDIVLEGITGGGKPWAPRLALQVGADPEVGQEFLVDLKEHLSLRTILRGMGYQSSPEAQVEFHRLGRALYPEAADQFAREFEVEKFLQPLAAAAPVTAFECCREVGRTLGEAGYHDGGQAIMRGADWAMGETDAWSNRLARTRTGEQLTQALNIFLDVDRSATQSAVAVLERRVQRRGEENEEESSSLLAWKARQAMFDSPTAATSLLATLERIRDGLGATIYGELINDPVVLQVFTFELQLLQWPSVQYAAARQLAAIGVLPDRAETEWMTQVARVKQQFVPILGSPSALADIIGMLAIWKQSWADRAVRSVDHAKLAARLRLGLVRDLAPAVALAGLHYNSGDPAGSGLILDALTELEPLWLVENIGLRQSVVLLELVRILRPERTRGLAAGIDASIGAHIGQLVVLDERRQWIEIGYASHSLKEAGFSVTASDAPRATPNSAHPAEVIWGLWHLPESTWTRRALAVASDSLLSNARVDRRSRFFFKLAAASMTGRLEEFGTLTAEESNPARFSFRQLRRLHELSRRNDRLTQLLGGLFEQVPGRLAERAAVVSWDAQRLASSLSAAHQQAANTTNTVAPRAQPRR